MKKHRTYIPRKIEQTLSLPEGTLYHALYMELSANRRAIIKGCRRIARYEQNVITLDTVDGMVTFEGNALCVECLQDGGAIISGQICTISFGGGV